MVRIILEDMKLNNNRRKPTILKKEVVPSDIPSKREREFYKDEIKKEKEVERVKEEKIDEYFKNKTSNIQRIQRTPQLKRKSKAIHKPILIIFIICILLGGVYWGGNFLQKATVTITSKHQAIIYNNKQFTASKDQTISNPVDFEIMIVSDNKPKKIILTDSKEVSVKATGSITLYNEFSLTPQKLSAGTFIMDSDGKTYKTDSLVTIPGYTIDENKKIISGQITANITSFLPGEAYNGDPQDFYISSFKGTAKYNKIYGKLKIPLTGGAQGLVYILNDLDKSGVNIIANSSLKEELLKQVKAQVPPGYILYPDALTFSYKIDDNFLSKTPDAEVPIDGTLSVVLLKEQSLVDNIIKISLLNISDDEFKEIKILDLDKLSFNFVDKQQIITKDMNSVSFLFTGNIDAVWNPDVEALKTKLLGVDKSAVLPIFRQDKGIASALVDIFPQWQKHIPNDVSKINIITK